MKASLVIVLLAVLGLLYWQQESKWVQIMELTWNSGFAYALALDQKKPEFIPLPNQTSIRVTVSLPVGVHHEVKALAQRIGCSEAAAMRILVMRGLEAMQASENPFKKQD